MIMEYIYKCLCFRKISKEKKSYKQLKKHLYYEKAERKLNKELDIVNMLK
jgi:hypothetical protein